jgi:hypothetical protein
MQKIVNFKVKVGEARVELPHEHSMLPTRVRAISLFRRILRSTRQQTRAGPWHLCDESQQYYAQGDSQLTTPYQQVTLGVTIRHVAIEVLEHYTKVHSLINNMRIRQPAPLPRDEIL